MYQLAIYELMWEADMGSTFAMCPQLAVLVVATFQVCVHTSVCHCVCMCVCARVHVCMRASCSDVLHSHVCLLIRRLLVDLWKQGPASL